jgi:hypothetical protein
MSRDAMALDPPDFIRGREVLERALKLLQVLHCSCLVFCYNYDSRPILSFIGSISAYLSRINVFFIIIILSPDVDAHSPDWLLDKILILCM